MIDLLLKKDYKERPNIDEVYDFLNNELKEEIIQKKYENICKKMIKLSGEQSQILKNKGNKIWNINSKKFF